MEFGSLTDQRPTGSHPIQAFVGDLVPGAFTDCRTSVVALELERTFWEKVTILHAEISPAGRSADAGPARATLRGCRRTVESRAGEGPRAAVSIYSNGCGSTNRASFRQVGRITRAPSRELAAGATRPPDRGIACRLRRHAADVFERPHALRSGARDFA